MGQPRRNRPVLGSVSSQGVGFTRHPHGGIAHGKATVVLVSGDQSCAAAGTCNDHASSGVPLGRRLRASVPASGINAGGKSRRDRHTLLGRIPFQHDEAPKRDGLSVPVEGSLSVDRGDDQSLGTGPIGRSELAGSPPRTRLSNSSTVSPGSGIGRISAPLAHRGGAEDVGAAGASHVDDRVNCAHVAESRHCLDAMSRHCLYRPSAWCH